MHPYPQLMMATVKSTDANESHTGLVLPPTGRMCQVGQDAVSLSSSPWIQRASSVPAPSGLPSDSGGDSRKKQLGSGEAEAVGLQE